MQVPIPKIINEKSFESHFEIRMRTEDVALSTVLNDRDIWRLGWVRDTKFGTNVFKMLLNAAKCQGYSFYSLWVIRGKPTCSFTPSPYPPKSNHPPSQPPRLGLNRNQIFLCMLNDTDIKIQLRLYAKLSTG